MENKDFHDKLTIELKKKLGDSAKVTQGKTKLGEFVIKPDNSIKATTMGHIEIEFGE